MMKRRRFLAGLGVMALVAVGAVGLERVVSEGQIVSCVRRRLSFLRLDEVGVRAYAQDQVRALLAKRPSWSRMKYHALTVFSKSYSRYDRSNDQRSRMQRLEDSFVETYLLSSDFFLNGADEARTVHYLAFYDSMRPCGNPFARSPV